MISLISRKTDSRPGIYKITCIENGNFYIGGSKNLYKRCYEHKCRFSKNANSNPSMQKEYDIYGGDKFVFQTLEFVDDIRNLLQREQYYIDTLNPYYNIARVAGSSKGRLQSEETKDKLRKLKTGKKRNYVHVYTDEIRKNISISAKKRGVSKEHLELMRSKVRKGKDSVLYGKYNEKAAVKLAKTYYFLSPEGVKTEIHNLNEFCRQHNISRGNMYHVLTGKAPSAKGWRKCIE